LSAHTSAEEMARAALESVAITFREIYLLMLKSLPEPKEIFASGGALLHSPTWTKMMADALGHSVRICTEKEATSRGAALLTLERIGAISDIAGVQPELGETFDRNEKNEAAYEAMAVKQHRLYQKLFEEGW
jgi:gluconokinase